jgi:endonuclease/exonuclease/phosphatase family metal-dependent hydrolase
LILTGDFNAAAGSAAYAALLGSEANAGPRLTDTYRAFHGADADAGTYHAFGAVQPAWLIDWILASGNWGVEAAEIDTTQEAGLYPSDHFPIIARLMRHG